MTLFERIILIWFLLWLILVIVFFFEPQLRKLLKWRMRFFVPEKQTSKENSISSRLEKKQSQSLTPIKKERMMTTKSDILRHKQRMKQKGVVEIHVEEYLETIPCASLGTDIENDGAIPFAELGRVNKLVQNKNLTDDEYQELEQLLPQLKGTLFEEHYVKYLKEFEEEGREVTALLRAIESEPERLPQSADSKEKLKSLGI